MLRVILRPFSVAMFVLSLGLSAPPVAANGGSAPPTVADISSAYFFTSFFHPTLGTAGEEAVMTAGVLAFDGAGHVTRIVQYDSSTGLPGGSSAGTYDVAPDGRLRFGNGLPFGLIGKRADFLVASGLSPSMDDPLGFLVAVRAGAPVVPTGRYYLVGIAHDLAPGGPEEFDVDAGYVDFDAPNHFTVHIEYPLDARETSEGTYTIEPDGRIAIDGGLPYGMISADGELMVIPTLDGDDRSLAFLMRQAPPLAVSDLVGRYYALETYHDVPVVDDTEMGGGAAYLDFDGRGRYFGRTTYEDGVGASDDRDSGTYGVALDGRLFADDEPGFVMVSADGSLIIAPQFAPDSVDRGVSILTGAPRFCDTGNVNLGAGAITDVLFVNGSNGGANRTVSVPIGEPIELALAAAPAGSRQGAYVLWGWAPAGARCTEAMRRLAADEDGDVGFEVLGCTLYPTPLTPALGPQPILCLSGAGIPASACGGAGRLFAGPAGVPFAVRDRNGLFAPLQIVLQGVIQDRGAANTAGFSVTNPIVLRVTAGG